jgi:hypothetical protein
MGIESRGDYFGLLVGSLLGTKWESNCNRRCLFLAFETRPPLIIQLLRWILSISVQPFIKRLTRIQGHAAKKRTSAVP